MLWRRKEHAAAWRRMPPIVFDSFTCVHCSFVRLCRERNTIRSDRRGVTNDCADINPNSRLTVICGHFTMRCHSIYAEAMRMLLLLLRGTILVFWKCHHNDQSFDIGNIGVCGCRCSRLPGISRGVSQSEEQDMMRFQRTSKCHMKRRREIVGLRGVQMRLGM